MAGGASRGSAQNTTYSSRTGRENWRHPLTRPTAQFPKPTSVGPRIWGQEILLVLAPGKYTMKLIHMNAGAAGGLQKHHKKDEAGYMLSGTMTITYDDGSGELKERIVRSGEWFHFPTGCVHKAVAATDVEYIEVSTPHFNDRVHVEAEYGIKVEAGGLPSTEEGDVVEW